jgi:phosphoglycerate dehydrogenase-like enzyme
VTRPPKIVLTDLVADYPPEALEALNASGIPFVDADAAGGDPRDRIADAEVLLVTWYNVSAEVIEGLRRCKVIVRIGVGYDNIDADAARRESMCSRRSRCLPIIRFSPARMLWLPRTLRGTAGRAGQSCI